VSSESLVVDGNVFVGRRSVDGEFLVAMKWCSVPRSLDKEASRNELLRLVARNLAE
jgi:hypothetical protein